VHEGGAKGRARRPIATVRLLFERDVPAGVADGQQAEQQSDRDNLTPRPFFIERGSTVRVRKTALYARTNRAVPFVSACMITSVQ
jgi:hypothetical protein